MMIVGGLVLLVYGLSTGMGKLAEKNMADSNVAYPSDWVPMGASANSDGTILLEFKNEAGVPVLVLMDPQRKKVVSTTILSPNPDQGAGVAFIK